ncbi:MAG TPA: ATP-binding cassette domain-containing protein [Candidatus Bathyarchaeia archaeon]|nr:ATP-binding cassette domain-containing protein [Candidatus Bathyarchaeia archaeon]
MVPLYAVETLGLSKKYGKTEALRGLDFTVKEGEIMVILGPNGSGKTTLLMILCTILKPSSGTAKVMGLDVVQDGTKVREVMGIAFQEARGFWRHKPLAILKFHASMFGLDAEKRRDLIEQTMKELELWESKDKLFMHLSGGQAKRLETAKILVQSPKLAIFDEPTSQVDLRGKRKIWDKIKELRDHGATIIVATNEVREAEYLADRVTILHQGNRIVTDSISKLKDAIAGGDIVEVSFEDPASDTLVNDLKSLGGALSLSPEGNQLRAKVSRAEDWVPKMASASYNLGAKISSIRITEPSLDDVFIHFTGKALEEK